MKQQYTHTGQDTLVSMTTHNPIEPAPSPPRQSAPSMAELEQWMNEDGGCEATDGCWVEPDGTCPHGKQSWLLELGLI